MNWEVFSHLSTIQVQVHWLLAVLAFFLGSVILLRKKGTFSHVILGRLWVAIMTITSLTALFIPEQIPEEDLPRLFGFSPIHLLVLITLLLLYVGIRNIRSRNVAVHKYVMILTFGGSLVLAGAFTFLPGRHMHTLFFGEEEQIQKYLDQGYKK